MRTSTILFGVATFVAGVALGFLASRAMNKQKAEEEPAPAKNDADKETEDKEDTEVKPIDPTKPQIHSNGPAKIATPEQPGVDYQAYAKKVEELGYKPGPGEIDIPEETYEERMDRENKELNEEYEQYEKKKGDKIAVLGSSPIDDEYPDIQYEESTIYYFTMDDLLVDEDGNAIDELEILGDKLRKFNWYSGDDEEVWVRNGPKKMDYHVVKYHTSYDDFFGEPYKDPDLEDNEV